MEIISHAANITKGSGIVTTEKIKQAIDSPANKIEIDLNLTKDGKFVCYRNPKFTGIKVSQLSLEQIQTIYPSILGLQDVFNYVKGQKPILMDIKDYDCDFYKLLSALLQNLETSDYNYLMAESNNLRLLNELKTARSDVETCLKFKMFASFEKFKQSDISSLSAIALPNRYFQDNNDYELYKSVLGERQRMYALSYNRLLREKPELFDKYISAGCDGIVTDEVMLLSRRLDK